MQPSSQPSKFIEIANATISMHEEKEIRIARLPSLSIAKPKNGLANADIK